MKEIFLPYTQAYQRSKTIFIDKTILIDDIDIVRNCVGFTSVSTELAVILYPHRFSLLLHTILAAVRTLKDHMIGTIVTATLIVSCTPSQPRIHRAQR